MKKISFLFVLFFAVLSIAGCAKCITCKKDDVKYKICSKNSDDKTYLDGSKIYYEAQGYKCSSSSEAF